MPNHPRGPLPPARLANWCSRVLAPASHGPPSRTGAAVCLHRQATVPPLPPPPAMYGPPQPPHGEGAWLRQGVFWVQPHLLVAQCLCRRATKCVFAPHQLPFSGALYSSQTGRVTCPWCRNIEVGRQVTRVADLTWTRVPVDWARIIMPCLFQPPGLLEFSTTCLQAGLTSDGQERPAPSLTFDGWDLQRLSQFVQDAVRSTRYDIDALRNHLREQRDRISDVYDLTCQIDERVQALEEDLARLAARGSSSPLALAITIDDDQPETGDHAGPSTRPPGAHANVGRARPSGLPGAH
jgi:hypothetical protein